MITSHISGARRACSAIYMYHKSKSGSLPSANSMLEKEGKYPYFFLRSLLLLLLMVCAASSILKLASPPLASSSPALQLAEVNRSEIDSLMTHISSKGNHLQAQEEKSIVQSLPCSALIDGETQVSNSMGDRPGILCCDRSHYRTDLCYMRGDVIRIDAPSSSILVHGADLEWKAPETIRPYTRKWESEVMATIDEITIRPQAANGNTSGGACDVWHHGVPGLVFSTGGYTGNVYHEFNDGLLPLYITTERFKGEVVLLVLEYHTWWVTKYRSVVEKMTNYKIIDFSRDRRVHCFSEMIVGLKIHDELTIDPKLMRNGKGLRDFQALLGQGFGGIQRQRNQQQQQQQQRDQYKNHLPPVLTLPAKREKITSANTSKHPSKIAIFVRNRSRVLLNLKEVVKACHRVGFDVQLLRPKRTTHLSEIYAALNSSDAMLAVHGAAMTHFLFMRPGTVLIQIVPLGLDWAADTYYGEPARKLGLEYVEYKVAPEESSLSKQYDRYDPVLVHPDAINSKGWWETKKIYLQSQNVRVNMKRFGRVLERAHSLARTSHTNEQK